MAADRSPFSLDNGDAGVSIHRLTPDVPDDGWYYLLRDGQIVKRYRGLPSARAAYKALLAEMGWTPPPRLDNTPFDPSILHIERFFEEHEAYWSQSSNFSGKGRAVSRHRH
jgi:hypothetical protein